jgi:hypothetical protein
MWYWHHAINIRNVINQAHRQARRLPLTPSQAAMAPVRNGKTMIMLCPLFSMPHNVTAFSRINVSGFAAGYDCTAGNSSSLMKAYRIASIKLIMTIRGANTHKIIK